MEQSKVQTIAVTAARGRLLAMDMVHAAVSGHIGGSLSSMDILTTLYFHVMRVNPANPRDPGRDRFVLSKGHCTPALYPMLALYGALGSVVSQLGDLSFSYIKREYGIKDYGNIFPGHGGVLDRFDSVIFCAPAIELLVRHLPAILS